MKAAVLRQINTAFSIEDIELDKPKAKEVKVKLKAVGLCHLEVHVFKGDFPAQLPAVLGHEGAGIVEEVGTEVTTVKPGDHVVLFMMPYCGHCSSCLAGKPYYCLNRGKTTAGGLMDGTSRLHTRDGERIYHFFGQGSLIESIVVDENTAVKVRDDAPLDKVCLLGCGASTGIGTILNLAKAEAGASVAVFGCGGVGLAAIMAANLAGAHPIIGIDIAEEKLTLAHELGATHTINGTKVNPVDEIKRVTGGAGAKYALEGVGNIHLINQALDSAKQDGMVIIIGGTPKGQTLSLDPLQLMGKMLTFSPGGKIIPAIDIPKYVDLYMDGKLPLNKLVSKTYRLDDINKAIDALIKGKILGRAVITF